MQRPEGDFGLARDRRPRKEESTRRFAFPSVIFILALSVRLGFCIATGTLGRTPEKGYREYVMAGERLLTKGAIVSPLILDADNAGVSALLPPGYVAYVAANYGLFGIESKIATFVLQFTNAVAAAMAAALAAAVAASAAQSAAGAFAGWSVGLLCALNPALIGFTPYIWETSLLTLGVVVSVWFSHRLTLKDPSFLQMFGFGLWLGVFALLNPALTIGYPLLVLYPLTRDRHKNFRRLGLGVVGAIAGWLLAITPWTIRNYVQFDKLIYVRSGFMLELWLGVCPEADQHGAAVYASQFPLNNDTIQKEVAEIGEESFVRDRGNRAMEAIATQPWRFAKLTGMKVIDYWTGAALTHAGPDGSGAIPRSLERVVVMIFYTAEILAAILLFSCRRTLAPMTWWLVGIIVSYAIVYCLTHVQVRFRAPTEPLMAMLLGLLAFGSSKAKDPRRLA